VFFIATTAVAAMLLLLICCKPISLGAAAACFFKFLAVWALHYPTVGALDEQTTVVQNHQRALSLSGVLV
jgi:hypothetical protein